MIQTSPIRTVIVDDEPLARAYLRELLSAHPEIAIVSECGDGNEAARVIDTLLPDLVFLDIQMPGLSGFEVLDVIEASPAVIFVTAYDQYALRAFEAHAIDYLLKPFAAERLQNALGRVVQMSVGRDPSAASLKSRLAPTPGSLRRIAIKDGSRITVLNDDEISSITAQDDYVAVCARGESFLKNQTISSLETALDPDKFVRIHRSTIININHLSRLELVTRERYVAIMNDRSEHPVSRSGHRRLREILES